MHVLHATHFVPLEYPDEVMAMLDGLLMRSDMATQADAGLVRRAEAEEVLLESTAVDLAG